MLKRICFLIFVVAIFTTLSITVYAADTLTFTFADVEVGSEQTVTVPLIIGNNSGIVSASLMILCSLYMTFKIQD